MDTIWDIDDLASDIGIPKELSDLKFDSLDDFLNFAPTTTTTTNNNNIKVIHNNNNNNSSRVISQCVTVREDDSHVTMYPSLRPTSYLAPCSPSGSWISTDDFPTELDGLYESGIDSDEGTGEGEGVTIRELTVPVVEIVDTEEEEEEEDSMNMEVSDKDEEMTPTQSRREMRTKRRKPRRYSSDFESDTDSSDTEYLPEEELEEPSRKRPKTARKEHLSTSDYESEEFEPEQSEAAKRQRRPSKNPVPQQRKKGSKLKISQWIVSLLRDPQFNPTVITWIDEELGKFKIVNSQRYAELWGRVKGNPNMNYEKLSRAMRYYYKNREISIVAGERLTYAFGPSMRDFRAKNRSDPNFERIHCRD